MIESLSIKSRIAGSYNENYFRIEGKISELARQRIFSRTHSPSDLVTYTEGINYTISWLKLPNSKMAIN